ncbi:glyoxalase [Actinomadura sp. NBRC 104412]|uniref:VOC family protein n=1 Tax=Actinomadura sp. NBRC 104412 TaxID=3032203 RepID=UPI0024A062D8|nr:VOC family protein [Actinomadura sp. NBRC 104412]GLZ06060.1 glyoxalase [Actinomadura sp. NBRC 104412]
MPEVTSHAPGWPSWVDLHSPDTRRSKEFYTDLFGWDAYTMTVPGFGDREMFTLGGIQGPEVAGMHPLADDTQPPSWMCYFRSDDIQATMETVRAAGGRELAPPADLANLGHMALCSDPEGADFALWTPYNLAGAGVVDEPSAMCWVELACRDTEQARRYYNEVFGWKGIDVEHSGSDYTKFLLGEDRPLAGMVRMDERWPQDVPPHWIPYFQVADCDEAAARAAGLGASIQYGPADIPAGRYAVMTDPTGARLAVMTPDPAELPRRS